MYMRLTIFQTNRNKTSAQVVLNLKSRHGSMENEMGGWVGQKKQTLSELPSLLRRLTLKYCTSFGRNDTKWLPIFQTWNERSIRHFVILEITDIYCEIKPAAKNFGRCLALYEYTFARWNIRKKSINVKGCSWYALCLTKVVCTIQKLKDQTRP